MYIHPVKKNPAFRGWNMPLDLLYTILWCRVSNIAWTSPSSTFGFKAGYSSKMPQQIRSATFKVKVKASRPNLFLVHYLHVHDTTCLPLPITSPNTQYFPFEETWLLYLLQQRYCTRSSTSPIIKSPISLQRVLYVTLLPASLSSYVSFLAEWARSNTKQMTGSSLLGWYDYSHLSKLSILR